MYINYQKGRELTPFLYFCETPQSQYTVSMRIGDEISQKQFKNDYQKAVINIIFSYNWLRSFFDGVLKPHGITSQQFNILRILRGQYPKPASVKLLRERMLDKMSDASRLVDKLVAKKLVSRDTNPSDRRAVNVIITESGLELLKKLDIMDEEAKQHLSALNENEIIQLNDLLDKMRG